ncbi:MAG: hypothetical protein KAV87_50040 [Desulfobacteraceae bacterium]|nr:hypothetical protein [Desulfobacteraceae bacterium]
MSEDRLVLNTKKSLYEPIEIEIDKQVYQSIKVTNATLKEINKIDDAIMKDPTSDKLLYAIVQLLFDIKPAILDKLDKREVEDIYTFSKRKFAEIEIQRAEIITKSFENAFQLDEKKKAKGKIPSGKRSGSKQ